MDRRRHRDEWSRPHAAGRKVQRGAEEGGDGDRGGTRKGGMRHQIKLAHIAIKALERKAEPFLEDQRAVKDEISGH